MFLKMNKCIFITAAILTLCGLRIFFHVSGAIAMENGVGEYRPSAFMHVEAKSIDSIVASKRQFEITIETRILDATGKDITIQSLPVPCIAQVDYENTAYGNPVALMIRIKQVFPGASTDWSEPTPE